ncbi:hypothetical protein [Permianibacter aggregans]|uniref:Uncharacterized protein n=1 Tax=Permianibacter aggregans TaxID=1510150 RepID=A0A4R6URZ3_9GAMM|nr:hypothetical protein [Permianibacter aggregans]QGX39423.1 hypothetical protein E2H98_07015 [Permianibacter aggregans]TDQ49841.1 hypothetical protein EV696_103214 [Permianibacter aggregans]
MESENGFEPICECLARQLLSSERAICPNRSAQQGDRNCHFGKNSMAQKWIANAKFEFGEYADEGAEKEKIRADGSEKGFKRSKNEKNVKKNPFFARKPCPKFHQIKKSCIYSAP